MKTIKQPHTHSHEQSHAFTLIEVCVALGVAAICLFALQGFIPTSLKVANNASDQQAASTMMASIAQDLRNTPSGATSSPGFGIPIPVDTTNASTLTSTNLYLAEDGVGVLSPSQARYAATVWISNNASATVTSLTSARIKVSWPPTGNSQGSVETVTTFNRQFQRGGAYVAAKVATNSSGSSSSSSSGNGSTGDTGTYGHDNGSGNNYQNNGCGNQANNGGGNCDQDREGCGGEQDNGCGRNK